MKRDSALIIAMMRDGRRSWEDNLVDSQALPSPSPRTHRYPDIKVTLMPLRPMKVTLLQRPIFVDPPPLSVLSNSRQQPPMSAFHPWGNPTMIVYDENTVLACWGSEQHLPAVSKSKCNQSNCPCSNCRNRSHRKDISQAFVSCFTTW